MDIDMIKGISGGQGIQVGGGSVSMPYISMGTPSAGMVRYNGNSQNLEVYDGGSWITIPSSYPTVELNGEAQAIMSWARTKMAEEQRMQDLAARHPTVADAITAREQADEAVRIAVALCDVK
jgi:hypothetical protein